MSYRREREPVQLPTSGADSSPVTPTAEWEEPPVTQQIPSTDMLITPDFTGQPGVMNGASELLGEIFGDVGLHARSAVGVAVLPLDTPVEVELIAEFA